MILPNRKLMETIDEEGYKYNRILEYDKVKEKEWKQNLAEDKAEVDFNI